MRRDVLSINRRANCAVGDFNFGRLLKGCVGSWGATTCFASRVITGAERTPYRLPMRPSFVDRLIKRTKVELDVASARLEDDGVSKLVGGKSNATQRSDNPFALIRTGTEADEDLNGRACFTEFRARVRMHRPSSNMNIATAISRPWNNPRESASRRVPNVNAPPENVNGEWSLTLREK